MTAYRIRIYRPDDQRQVHARSFNARDDQDASVRATAIYQYWRNRNRASAHGTEFTLYRLQTKPICWITVILP